MDLRIQFEKETGETMFDSSGKTFVKYIEWLEKRVPQWIDVNVQLPDKFKRVLVTDGDEVTQAYLGHVKDTFQGQFLLNEEWLGKPTHWANLPLPVINKRGTEAEP